MTWTFLMRAIVVTVVLLPLLASVVMADPNAISSDRAIHWGKHWRKLRDYFFRRGVRKTEPVPSEETDADVVHCDVSLMEHPAKRCSLHVTGLDDHYLVSPVELVLHTQRNSQHGTVVVLGRTIEEKLKKVCPEAEFPDYSVASFEAAAAHCGFKMTVHRREDRADIQIRGPFRFPLRGTRHQCESAEHELRESCEKMKQLNERKPSYV